MLSINFDEITKTECEHFCDGYVNEEGTKISGVVSWVRKKVKKYLTDENLQLPENEPFRDELLHLANKLSIDGIKEILECDYNSLQNKSTEYSQFNALNIAYKKGNEIINCPNVLNLIFNYSAFRSYKKTIYNGFFLSEKLGIDCCPYCNRNYTTSHQTYFLNVNDENIQKYVFPEFDHFYPKAEHAVIALSFYNLIPSCNICNTHYKNDRDSTNLFHPYTKVKPNHFEFKGFPNDVASLYGSSSNISIGFNYSESLEINKRLKESIIFFGIKDVYEKCHTTLIKEITHKRIAFSERYMKELQDTYKMSFEDSYKIVFETHFEEGNLHKRPFSKLKKDIYNSLK